MKSEKAVTLGGVKPNLMRQLLFYINKICILHNDYKGGAFS